MKDDRHTKAYNLRFNLHTWIKEHGPALMDEIYKAYADIPKETIRKAIATLRKYKSLKAEGERGKPYVISVVSNQLVTADSMRRKKQPGAFERCEIERQKVLDVLNNQGSLTSIQVAEILKINPDTALRTIYRMEAESELVRNGKGKKQTFTAIVVKTVTADEMRKRIEFRKRETTEKTNLNKKKVAKISQVAGYYRHKEHRNIDHEPPLKNQEGIGSSRGKVYINYSYNY